MRKPSIPIPRAKVKFEPEQPKVDFGCLPVMFVRSFWETVLIIGQQSIFEILGLLKESEFSSTSHTSNSGAESRLNESSLSNLFPSKSDARDCVLEPIRRLNRTRQGMQLSHFSSKKMDRVIMCESSIEADLALVFECEPDVVAYCEQPETIPLRLKGRLTSYTPDFLTQQKNGPETIWEVKPSYWQQSPYWVDRLSTAKRVWEERGYRFQVVTDDDLRGSHLIANLRLIYPRLGAVTPAEIFQVKDFVDQTSRALNVRQLMTLSQVSFGAVAAYVYAYCREKLDQRFFDMSFPVCGGLQ